MLYCLEKGYDPEKVEGEVLKDRSILFLKYRELIRGVLNSDLSFTEKAAKLGELQKACNSLLVEYYNDPDLQKTFDDLFAAGTDNNEIEQRKKNFDLFVKYDELLYKRQHFVTEGYTRDDEEEDKKYIDFNQPLIKQIEAAYTKYNLARARDFADAIKGYKTVVKEADQLKEYVETRGGVYTETPETAAIREKYEKIQRYFALANIRKDKPLSEAEQNELNGLLGLGIEEIDKIEAAYQDFMKYYKMMQSYLKNYDSEKKPVSLDSFAVPKEEKGLTVKKGSPYEDKPAKVPPDGDEKCEDVEVNNSRISLRIKRSIIYIIGGILGATGLFFIAGLIASFISGTVRRFKEGGERLLNAFGLDDDKEHTGEASEPDHPGDGGTKPPVDEDDDKKSHPGEATEPKPPVEGGDDHPAEEDDDEIDHTPDATEPKPPVDGGPTEPDHPGDDGAEPPVEEEEEKNNTEEASEPVASREEETGTIAPEDIPMPGGIYAVVDVERIKSIPACAEAYEALLAATKGHGDLVREFSEGGRKL